MSKRKDDHFADEIFKHIFLNRKSHILIQILLNFVPDGPNNKCPALVQKMAWYRTGDKPVCQLMVV